MRRFLGAESHSIANQVSLLLRGLSPFVGLPAWRVGPIIGLVFVLVLCAQSATALAANTVTFSTVYYSIRGKTVAELIAEQRTKGSNKEAGWTDFKYDWKWNTNSSEGKFNVTNTGVAITITMRMPRWEDEDQAKKCLQQNWDKSSANLLKHENMHITLAEGLEKQIEKAIIDVPAQASDAELTVAVNAAANSTIQKNKIIQMKFDRDTNHGEKRSKIPNRVEGLQMKRNPKASAWQILP